MADIIVENLSVGADLEASIETAMIDAEMNTDSNLELALDVITWGGSKSRANLDNYLAKDNEVPYEPVGIYNPATKGYVDVNALIHRTGEELFNNQEPLTGVIFCTEGYGDYFLEGGVYEYENGELIKVIELSGVGGTTNQSETVTPLEINTAVGQSTILEYDFKSKSSGKGTAKLFINGVLKSSKIISKGINSFDITEYVKEGTNYFTITITDGSNNIVSFDYIVNGVKLTIKSSFNESQVYTGDVIFSYTVIGAGLKTVTFVIDNEEVGSVEIKSSGEQSKYTITGLSHGGHILKVKATTTVNEILIESNELVCQILYAEENVTTPIISSSFSQTTALEGETLNIDYIIYDPANAIASALLQVNDETPLEIQTDRNKHYWNISKYPIGDVIFKIKCGDTVVELPVTVTKLEMDIEPVTDDLVLYLTSANRSNEEAASTREVWSFNDITAELTNINWVSNGWIDGALKFTGEAYGFIPYEIFKDDAKVVGKTIEIEFATHNIQNYESILLSCFTEGKGIQVTPTEAFLKSEQEEVKVRFKEGEKVRVSFVIESSNDNKLIKLYVNGVLSGVTQYDSSDNFQQGTPLGISINEGKEEIDIYNIRIYNIALSSRQVLNNYICDLSDISEKIAKYQANNVYDLYGSIAMAKIKSMIPILTITGDLPPVKGEKKTVSTVYTDPLNPAMNFTKSDCIIDIQGTSSQYYPKKNYKIKFPEAFSFYEGAVPESEYTFKADYMESSHSHNTGNAILVNTLYDEFFPTQTAENGVRNTIYGFPCAIYYRTNEAAEFEYFGVYNFNNDKGNAATLGLVGDKAQSWEFKNNTSTHCLLRNDDFSPEAKPEDNFEARYPDKYTDYTDLQRVVSWIVSTDGDLEKFKNEFNQHFNLHYCLIYYVMLEWGLMMDSRAKNMFFDTIDGNIWYPRMYDMDTCYGLNNEGVLNFSYGLEQHDEDIYNGENSLFWNNFEQVYAQEIKDMYLSLRTSGKLSYENMMYIFKECQMDKICEAQYNEDAQFKYLGPIIADGDTTYSYVAQGNRLSHFQWWVSNRIKYLDSKYEAADYISDYITMRMYTNSGTITLTPYIDQYLKIKYGSSDVAVRGEANKATIVPCPSGLTFNDTETIIYGANNISSLGDLANKYPGTVDVSKGSKLIELKIGDSASGYSNSHLTTLTLGNNKLLRSIDVSNCPNLTGNLDVSSCTALREFKSTGSGLKGITFVDGGDLETLELPTSLTNLTIKNHKNLTSISPSSFENLQTLVLKNTGVNASDIFMSSYKTLTRVYCIFEQSANVVFSNAILNYLINNCKGVDDTGANLDYPNLQGYLTVEYPSSFTSSALASMKEKYAQIFPYLNITYKSTTLYYTYNKSNNALEVFGSLSANLPEAATFPNREELEESLGLASGTINENTIFRMASTGSTSYKSTLKRLILPEGYAGYYLQGYYFPNLKKIIWPAGPTKITYFDLRYDNRDGLRWEEQLDFSAPNLDISALSALGADYYYTSSSNIKDFSGFNFKGKTMNNYIYTPNFGSNLGSTYQFSGFVRPISSGYASGMHFTDINLEDVTINSSATRFGSFNYSTNWYITQKGIKLNAKNMKLNKMTDVTFRDSCVYSEVDISNTQAPLATTLSFSAGWTVNSSNSATTSAYNSYVPYGYYYGESSYPDFLKKVVIKNISMPNLTTINFHYAMSLTDLELEIDTSNMTSLQNCFRWCKSLTKIPFEAFSTQNVTNMSGIFSNCRGITNYDGLSAWDFTNVTSASAMFEHNILLTEINLENFAPAALTAGYAMFNGNTELQSINMPNFDTSLMTSFTQMFRNNSSLTNLGINLDLSSATSTKQMFYGCSLLDTIDILNDDLLELTNASYMFYNCTSLSTLGKVSNWLMSKVTDFSYFVRGCHSLKDIVLNTDAKPTTIAHMFNETKANSISLPNLDTSATTSFAYAFANNPELTSLMLGPNFVTSSATDLSYMFYNTPLNDFDLSHIDTSKVTNLEGMFQNCKLTSEHLDLIRSWDTSKVTNMKNLFRGAFDGEEFSLAGLNLSAVTEVTDMLSDNPNLKAINIDGVDFSSLSVSNILTLLTPNTIEKVDTSQIDKTGQIQLNPGYSAVYYYGGKTQLKELIIPNIDFRFQNDCYIYKDAPLEIMSVGRITPYYYSSASYQDYWYQYKYLCSGRKQLRSFSTKALEFYSAYSWVNLSAFFQNCESLEEFDFGETDTSYNTSLNSMFQNCKAIENIDLSWMATNSTKDLQYLFDGCSSLKTFNLNNFIWSQVTNISYLCRNCTSLEHVELVIPNAPILTTATELFNGCTNLKTVDLTNADLNTITSMSHWFYKCSSLEEIDLSYLDISKVTAYNGLFRECANLKKVNLSCIKNSANINAQYMFENCKKLEEIDIRNWDINKLTTASNYTSIFTNVPYTCKIIVKNETCRTWVKNRNSAFNNIKLPSEL